MTRMQRAQATMDCCRRRPKPSDGFDPRCEVVRVNGVPGFDHVLWGSLGDREDAHAVLASLALDGYPARARHKRRKAR
jgi:hypothetical protein